MELSSEYVFGTTGKSYNLYPHQATAAQWMKMISYNVGNPKFMKGGMINDEMGLGKTNTCCAVIASTPVPSTLVLCQPSTRFQWLITLLNTVSDITIYTIEKDKYCKCSLVVKDGIEDVITKALNESRGECYMEPAIVVANYKLVTTGTKNDKLVTDKVWYQIFVDEAHFLRNDNSSYEKLLGLKQPEITTNGITHRFGTRWCITGTPIQMGRQDLVNLFRFVDDRFLTTKNAEDLNKEMLSLVGTNLFRRNINQISPYMKKYMQYPDKEPITYNEKAVMPRTNLSNQLEKLEYEQLVDFCDKNRAIIPQILEDERAFLIAKTTEMKFLNFRSDFGAFTESTEFKELISYPFSSVPAFMTQIQGNDLQYKGPISTFEILKRIIASTRESYVIFHHYKPVARKIAEMISRFFPNYKVYKISGDVQSDKERFNIVQAANLNIANGVPVILISSIGATAEGMNYQKFSNIVMMDSEYNEKTEEQAKFRVQRIGQKNVVKIYTISLEGFMGPSGLIDIAGHINDIKKNRTHISDFIDVFNAAFTFRRYYVINSEGQKECGVYFGREFESKPQGSFGGPNSVGPRWIK